MQATNQSARLCRTVQGAVMAITLSLGAALPAGATIAVSSRISLLADADAGNNLVSDSNSVSQGATINPLGPISVDAVSVDGGATARAFATVGSTWTSASAGQVVFSNVGFSSSGVSFGSAGFPFQGLDWEYVFIATDTGEFDLDFSVSIGAGTTDSFGLNPIIFLWSGAGGGDFFDVGTSGSISRDIVAGTQYSFGLRNQSNIGGALNTRQATLDGTIIFRIPEPSSLALLGLALGLIPAFRRRAS